ncbi:hypothetical protein StoSoilB5_11670 [Arthrobacter sp. StoSoilB5]|nr:hypothetical protein StoSoilB5_11670 [Arthrobacter sp. StoSoilB5]
MGSQTLMTPPGDEPIQLRIAEVVDGEVFVDEHASMSWAAHHLVRPSKHSFLREANPKSHDLLAFGYLERTKEHLVPISGHSLLLCLRDEKPGVRREPHSS